jgi:hypothetical protein
LRALDEGRLNANGRVASALFKKATGYEVKAEKLFQFRGEVVRGEYVEHIPPDTSAASFWLRNRAPELWKERCEVDVGGSIEHKFAAMTPDERRADARSLADEIRRAIADGTLIEGEVEDVTDAEDITDEPDLGDLV